MQISYEVTGRYEISVSVKVEGEIENRFKSGLSIYLESNDRKFKSETRQFDLTDGRSYQFDIMILLEDSEVKTFKEYLRDKRISPPFNMFALGSIVVESYGDKVAELPLLTFIKETFVETSEVKSVSYQLANGEIIAITDDIWQEQPDLPFEIYTRNNFPSRFQKKGEENFIVGQIGLSEKSMIVWTLDKNLEINQVLVNST